MHKGSALRLTKVTARAYTAKLKVVT